MIVACMPGPMNSLPSQGILEGDFSKCSRLFRVGMLGGFGGSCWEVLRWHFGALLGINGII